MLQIGLNSGLVFSKFILITITSLVDHYQFEIKKKFRRERGEPRKRRSIVVGLKRREVQKRLMYILFLWHVHDVEHLL